MKECEKLKRRQIHSSIRQNSCGGQGSAHLIPGNVWIFAWLHVVIDVRAEDLFALAELGLLLPSHVGIVAQAGVILCHSQGHGHLHAVGGVSVSTGQMGLITFRFLLSAIYLSVISVTSTRRHSSFVSLFLPTFAVHPQMFCTGTSG